MTPLMAVAEKRHGQLVLLLLEADADPNKANHKFKTALHLAVEQASRAAVQQCSATVRQCNSATAPQPFSRNNPS